MRQYKNASGAEERKWKESAKHEKEKLPKLISFFHIVDKNVDEFEVSEQLELENQSKDNSG